ncbi:MAG: hypothetical protein J5818_01025, partial [Eggerthellaceae bacterium]|nr:hypothetical protein [Eggerthellaceae bacterium]
GTYPGAASYQEAVPMAPMAPVAPQKKSKLPLVLFLVALAALAAAAAVMFGMRGCSLAGPTSSPESAVQSAADAALDLDFNRMLDSVAPDVVDYGIAAAGYSSRDDLVAFLDNSVAQLDETVGIFGIDARSLMKFINVKTTDVSYYSEEGLTGLRSEWNGRVPGFGDKIQDAATVTVEFSGQFDLFGKSVSLSDYIGSTTQYVTTAKVDGQWYVLEADLRDLKALLP